MDEKQSRLKDGIGKIVHSRLAMGCFISALFLIVFAFLAWIQQSLSKDIFDDIQWILILSLVIVLPFLLEYARPIMTGIKIANLLEINFKDFEASTTSLEDLATQLKFSDMDKIKVEEYAGRMTSYSNVIIQKIREIQEKQIELLPIDLGTGKSWLLPNLYFLALLSAYRTNVRQFIFTEMVNGDEHVFVGMSSPRNLIARFALEWPILERSKDWESEKSKDYRYDRLDIELGNQFFSTLRDKLKNDPQPEAYKQWITSYPLVHVLGTALNKAAIEYKDWLTGDDYRYIITCPQRYIAAVRDRQYLFTIDRDKVSLEFARKAVKEAAS